MTIILMLAIGYIGYILTQTPEKNSQIAPQKTKAQNISYSRIIALNRQNQPTVFPSVDVSPTDFPSPTIYLSPSPTEIILAYRNPVTTTPVSSISATVTSSLSPSPTKITTLPKTGFINNTVIIFGSLLLFIFMSFIF